MIANIAIPQKFKIGGGAVTKIQQLLSELGCSYPYVMTDPTMVSLGYAQRLEQLLIAGKIQYSLFSNVMPEPNDVSIEAAVEQIRASQFDCIIALGGGSAIDSAKAAALLASHGGRMRDYKVPVVINHQSLPVIAIPTTAGTGSEATKATIIADSISDEKMLCMGDGLIPTAAIIDYEFTLSLPKRIAADTGIDALTHGIEAYISGKANLFSDQQAIAAMKLIAPNLIAGSEPNADHAAKEAMMLGATLAGIAFSNASVALVHGMSRPLGVHFHVPHGMSNAMLLASVTEFSLSGAAQKYAECALHMGLIEKLGEVSIAHQALLAFLNKINKILEVPSLAEFGVNQTEYFSLLEKMAEQAIASGSPANNPVVPSKQQIVELYKKIWR